MVREYIPIDGYKFELFRFAWPGKMFGNAWLSNKSLGADAKTELTVCFFDYKVINELFLQNPKAAFDFMSILANEHGESVFRLMSFAKMSLREKVAGALYHLYRQFGTNHDKELPEYFSREDIAGIAMTTPEQVSRQLTEFEQGGIIAKHGRRIALLQPVKLKTIIKEYHLI